VTCPAGHTTQVTTSKKGARTARISRAHCRACPLAHRYGARKSRYIGSDKARLQASWAAAVVNLNPTLVAHPLRTRIRATMLRRGDGR
jgi:hypothetical protein